MNIFFDLDGTLIDARQRLYGLFRALIPECSMTFEEYWEIKRQQLDHKYILSNHYHYAPERFDEFNKTWMAEVERESWIDMDQPFTDTTSFLKSLSAIADLYIVTARQHPAMVQRQIERFGWQNIFKQVLVTCQENEKEELIRPLVTTSPSDFFVGDTGKDIQAGQALGIRTIGVLSGFRNEQQLQKYKPEFIVDNITSFKFENYLPK